MTKARGKISRTDEDTVDSVHAGNLFETVKCLLGFDLNQQAQLLRRPPGIARDASEACRAGQSRHTTNSVRRIAHGSNGLSCLVGVLHVRDQQSLSADIEKPFDQDGIIAGRPDDRSDGVGCDGLKLSPAPSERRRASARCRRAASRSPNRPRLRPHRLRAGCTTGRSAGARRAGHRLKALTGSCIVSSNE